MVSGLGFCLVVVMLIWCVFVFCLVVSWLLEVEFFVGCLVCY